MPSRKRICRERIRVCAGSVEPFNISTSIKNTRGGRAVRVVGNPRNRGSSSVEVGERRSRPRIVAKTSDSHVPRISESRESSASYSTGGPRTESRVQCLFDEPSLLLRRCAPRHDRLSRGHHRREPSTFSPPIMYTHTSSIHGSTDRTLPRDRWIVSSRATRARRRYAKTIPRVPYGSPSLCVRFAIALPSLCLSFAA